MTLIMFIVLATLVSSDLLGNVKSSPVFHFVASPTNLKPGFKLRSVNGKFETTFQHDGNLVTRQLPGDEVHWSSNSRIQNKEGQDPSAKHTDSGICWNNPSEEGRAIEYASCLAPLLDLQSDGNLVIYCTWCGGVNLV